MEYATYERDMVTAELTTMDAPRTFSHIALFCGLCTITRRVPAVKNLRSCRLCYLSTEYVGTFKNCFV